MDEPVAKNDGGDDEVNLVEYLLVIAKHNRVIIFTSIAMTILTFLFLFISPNLYTAEARLMPPQQNMTLSAQILDSLSVGSSSGGGGGIGGVAASFLGLKSPGDLYVGIIKGDTIADRIIQRFDLRNYASFSSSKNPKIEDLREKLAKISKIESGKEGLIEIGVTFEDPKIAAQMANAFGEELDRLLLEISHKDAENQLAFLEKERAQTSVNLTKAENALRSFSEKTNVIQIDAQTKGMLEYIASLRASIDAKEVEVKVLQQQATPANFDLIRLETEVKGLKDKLRATEKQTGTSCVGDICLPSSTVPVLGLEYIRLYREAKYQETVYELYSKLTELARLDAARNVATVLFVDRATLPEKRSKPKRILVALIVGFAMFCLMIFGAFFQEYLKFFATQEDQVKQFEELRSYFQPWRELPRRFLSKLKQW